MRIPAAAALVMLWALSPAHDAAKAANDAEWCYRDFGSRKYTYCDFPTARRCLDVALIMGGVCERNPRPMASEPRPKVKWRHS